MRALYVLFFSVGVIVCLVVLLLFSVVNFDAGLIAIRFPENDVDRLVLVNRGPSKVRIDRIRYSYEGGLAEGEIGELFFEHSMIISRGSAMGLGYISSDIRNVKLAIVHGNDAINLDVVEVSGDLSEVHMK